MQFSAVEYLLLGYLWISLTVRPQDLQAQLCQRLEYQETLVQQCFLFAGSGKGRAPSSTTLYRRERFARVYPNPRASGFEFEEVEDIHAAWRTSREPAVHMSFRHILEHADIYLTSLVNIDQSPAIDDDKDGGDQEKIMRVSHA